MINDYITIRELKEKLLEFNNNDLEIRTDDNYTLTYDFGAYRACDSIMCLYIGFNGKYGTLTVGKLIELLDEAVKVGRMTGHNGGLFIVNSNTEVILSDYQTKETKEIINLYQDNNKGQVIIVTNNDNN